MRISLCARLKACVHECVLQNEVNVVLLFFLWCVIMKMDVRSCELRGLLLHGGSVPLSH